MSMMKNNQHEKGSEQDRVKQKSSVVLRRHPMDVVANRLPMAALIVVGPGSRYADSFASLQLAPDHTGGQVIDWKVLLRWERMFLEQIDIPDLRRAVISVSLKDS